MAKTRLKFYTCQWKIDSNSNHTHVMTATTQTPALFGLQFRLLLLSLPTHFIFTSLSCSVLLSPFYSCPVFSISLSSTKQAWGCGSVNTYHQDRFLSNLDKPGQIYKLVTFQCLQHIIPTFTPFSFYRSRNVDDRQKQCNAQAVNMKLRSVASNHIQLVCIY